MSNRVEMGSAKRASLTIMVDNKADLIVESTDRVRYFTDEPLLAEHGFSVLIQLDDSEHRILWDAGVSRVALIENLHRMKIDPASIQIIALSHGHLDHYAAMTDVLVEMDLLPKDREWDASVTAEEIEAWMEASRIPIVAHPAAFRERWLEREDGSLVGPGLPPPEGEWRSAGAKLVLSEKPYRLAPGCWTTGYVPRRSFEESGRPKDRRYRAGSDFLPDDLEEDQAIVIHVEGKGLVILSGCAHSGIVNTIMHAMEFSQVDTIYAVIGGFHLARASDAEIDRTIETIQGLKPSLVSPSHCTGFKAIRRFAEEMPDEFIEGVVGATYLF